MPACGLGYSATCLPDPAGSRLRDSTRMLILVSRCLRLVCLGGYSGNVVMFPLRS